MSDTPTAARTAVTVPDFGTYRIDPARSTISYTGKHLFGLGTVHATFSVRTGEFRLVSPIINSGASVTVDAASFTSDRTKRDKDVCSAGLLDVATYPDILFRSVHLTPQDGGWTIPGTVTAHGQSVPVVVTVDAVTAEDGGYRVHATALHLDRTAFGVTGSKGMVGRWLDLDLDVFASLVPARRDRSRLPWA